MKKIAILTSGGDAPGMNAAIASIVRAGNLHDLAVFGVLDGYEGLIEGRLIELNLSSVKNLIQRGGTILKSARSKRFLEYSFRELAFNQLKSKEIQGLIVLGGDGTFKGAAEFAKEFDFPIIGIPCTIDNDLVGTDYCIGFDTATNTAMDAIDKIRDTAESHNRLFFVEVMGREAGSIAMRAGIAGGAEAILIPETKMNVDQLITLIKRDKKLNYNSLIIVVAEGDEEGGAYLISEKVKKDVPDLDIRITVLGHTQRGGRPSCMDRVLATRMGIAAVEFLIGQKRNGMVGIINDEIQLVSFEKSIQKQNSISDELLNVLEVIAY
jgi:6-phosphofructokinase 1